MTGPTDEAADEPTDPAGGADREATLEERVNAALDTCNDVLDALEVLPGLLQRVKQLEGNRGSGGDAGEASEAVARSDYRFEAYPTPADEAEQEQSRQRATLAWAQLLPWVRWLVATFRLSSVVPACWPLHPAVREELISLRVSWADAWADDAPADAPLVWLERLERARARLGDGNWGMARCDGIHHASGLDNASIYQQWQGHSRAVDAATRITAEPVLAADLGGEEQ
jgi:hypothetical protein